MGSRRREEREERRGHIGDRRWKMEDRRALGGAEQGSISLIGQLPGLRPALQNQVNAETLTC
jgi:hypothetical protein